jgi:hypothetical protein
MRLLGLSIVALALAWPASARAQTTTLIDIAPPPPRGMKMKDLVGSWARAGEKEVRFTFRADSTVSVSVQTNAGAGTATGRWRLMHDTLAINNFTVTIKGQKGSVKFDRRQVAIKDKKMTLTRVENGEQGPKMRVYERVDAPKADQPKP